MRIIDEKGRLFGKINVIDFLVILFLISLTPMFYYGYKIFNAPPPPPPPPPQIIQEWVTVKVKVNGLIPEIVSLINKDDYEGIIKPDIESEEADPKTKEGITAIVKDNPIVESQKSLSFYDYKEYRWLPYPSTQKDVSLSLEILCIKKDDGLLYYKNNPVKVGASFSFQTKEYDINGTIIGIEK